MWFEGTYACGHDGRVQIYGPSKDRERIAAQEFSKLCRACYIAQMQQIAQKNAQSKALPALHGSEKQIAWAMCIRDGLLTAHENENIPAQIANATNYVINHMTRKQTDASWWIDHRDRVNNVMGFVRYYMVANPEVHEEAKKLIIQ